MRNITPEEEARAFEFIRNLDSSRVEQVLALKSRRPRMYRAMILRSLNMQRHAEAMHLQGNTFGYQRSIRLFKEMFETRQEMDSLMMAYRRADSDSVRETMRYRFVEAAGRVFDAQTELSQLQIVQMKEELGRLQLQVDERQAKRERVIRRQVEIMLTDDDDLD